MASAYQCDLNCRVAAPISSSCPVSSSSVVSTTVRFISQRLWSRNNSLVTRSNRSLSSRMPPRVRVTRPSSSATSELRRERSRDCQLWNSDTARSRSSSSDSARPAVSVVGRSTSASRAAISSAAFRSRRTLSPTFSSSAAPAVSGRSPGSGSAADGSAAGSTRSVTVGAGSTVSVGSQTASAGATGSGVHRGSSDGSGAAASFTRSNHVGCGFSSTGSRTASPSSESDTGFSFGWKAAALASFCFALILPCSSISYAPSASHRLKPWHRSGRTAFSHGSSGEPHGLRQSKNAANGTFPSSVPVTCYRYKT